MEKVMRPLGRHLKELRKEKKVKQKEMAAFLNCSERNYQKMEYGEVNVPGLTLMKLADFFEVSIDYLVGRSEERRVSNGGQSE